MGKFYISHVLATSKIALPVQYYMYFDIFSTTLSHETIASTILSSTKLLYMSGSKYKCVRVSIPE